MDRIAAYLFENRFTRGSAKIYLGLLGRFSSDPPDKQLKILTSDGRRWGVKPLNWQEAKIRVMSQMVV